MRTLTHHELLKKLVEINSVYPNEEEISNFCIDLLKDLNFDIDVVDIGNGRKNILAKRGKGDTAILFYGHLDTVGVVNSEEWNTDPFKLTQKGLLRLLSKFPQIKFHNRTWDGLWRVVIYDIEETSRTLRNLLRSKLRQLGFNLVQRSVWFSPYPIENELERFLKEERLWEKIMVFKTELSAEDNQRLVKEFYPHLKIVTIVRKIGNIDKPGSGRVQINARNSFLRKLKGG